MPMMYRERSSGRGFGGQPVRFSRQLDVYQLIDRVRGSEDILIYRKCAGAAVVCARSGCTVLVCV